MKRFNFLILVLVCMLGIARATEVQSPDGRIRLSFALETIGGQTKCPVYSITYRGRPILASSRLGFDLESGEKIDDEMEILSFSAVSRDTIWHPVYGERSTIRDHYNELTIRLRQITEPHYRMDIRFRCYNAGVALCYTILKSENPDTITISQEKTEFRFRSDHTAWTTTSAQGIYRQTTLSKLPNGSERPLTIEIDDTTFVALAEARLVDYARMKLSRSGWRPFSLISHLSGPVHARLPMTTPWRVVMIAETPGRLLENNDIILNLNDPCAIQNTSWIKPGKVIREISLTTTGAIVCVDFAARHHLQFVEFDAGWYGHEYADSSDATTVTVDPKRSPGPLDLHKVIRYAEKRGIGIILYVNRRALEKQIDDILPLYQQWGIKGVKYGFVRVGSQKWTTWLHQAIRKAARYRLMIDVHDEYRPTGYSRTYPNFMTQEGIAGDETSPTNRQTLTILFTRMLAGAADNTICYFDKRVEENATHAYQLAKAVCLYSPWQFLYWYDRPGTASGQRDGSKNRDNIITEEPELSFFDALPTVWDDTKVIHGKIGEYAVIARRSGNVWFIGCMNGDKARTLDVPLNFLPPGKYIATIYSDDDTVPTRTKVKIRKIPVTAHTILKAALKANGGQALIIEPAAGN